MFYVWCVRYTLSTAERNTFFASLDGLQAGSADCYPFVQQQFAAQLVKTQSCDNTWTYAPLLAAHKTVHERIRVHLWKQFLQQTFRALSF